MNYKHGMGRTPTYRSWQSMKDRCNNPNNQKYKYYGKRGIEVCDEWQDSFENFFKDMGVKSQGLTLDRKDNNGNYEPGNCRWTTYHKQRVNSRPRSYGPMKQYIFVAMDYQGTIIASNNQREFAKKYGLDPSTISACLHGKYKQHKGWVFQWIK
jgi:hypothetical protein